ncbi:putative RNA-directed DNA polymerase [Tanacetum coccineum]
MVGLFARTNMNPFLLAMGGYAQCARIFFQSLDAAIFLFSRVSQIPTESLVLPVISTNDRLTLGCRMNLWDGTIIRGQNEISHPTSGSLQLIDKVNSSALPSMIKRIINKRCEDCPSKSLIVEGILQDGIGLGSRKMCWGLGERCGGLLFRYSRSEKCVMMGFSSSQKGYRLSSLDRHQFLVSRDVKFFESIFPFKESISNKNKTSNVFQDNNLLNFFDLDNPELPDDDESVRNNHNSDPKSLGTSSSTDSGNNVHIGQSPSFGDIHCGNGDDVNLYEEVRNLDENQFSEGTLEINPSTSSHGQNQRGNLEGTSNNPAQDFVSYSKLSGDILCFVTHLNKNSEPRSFFEASQSPQWIDAMNLEMSALLENDTWELVELPFGRKALNSKWVWKLKFKSSGEIERYKARLVAMGCAQKEGVDYEETFSPVVKMVTVRCLINLAVNQSWPIYQLDINNAFLYGDLDETVYMKPPQGFYPGNDKLVCRLKKSIYGLKQSPRQWNAKLTSVLVENGFCQSKSDYSLYTKSVGDVFLALLVYVDDIIVTGNKCVEIEKFKVFLKGKFKIKDLGKLKYFLGIEVVDTSSGICLNQRKYVLDLLSEYGMLACKPSKTPLWSSCPFSNEKTNKTDYLTCECLGNLVAKSFLLIKVFPTVNPSVLEQLRNVDCIIYGMGSLFTSICPSLPSQYINTIFVPKDGQIPVDIKSLAAQGIVHVVPVESMHDPKVGIVYEPTSLIQATCQLANIFDTRSL